MRILTVALLVAIPVFAQTPTAPVQGPPPKNLTKQPDGHISANAMPANPDKFETHIVAQGETLSGIAGQVMKDSKLWPQLWEANDHIVNPHWIYPDDKILVRPVTKITEAAPPPPAALAAAPEPTPPAPVAAVAPPPPPPPPPPPQVPASVGIAVLGPHLASPASAAAPVHDVFELPAQRVNPPIKASDVVCSGFVRSEKVPASLKVTGTHLRDNALLSTNGQYVQISQGSKAGVTAGSTFQVIRPTLSISDANRRIGATKLGMHYLDVGQIQIVEVHEASALARVTGNCEAVEVNDLLIPYTPYEIPEIPRNRSFSSTMTTTGQLVGSIVFMKNIVASAQSTYHTSNISVNKVAITSEGGVVFIDLGKADSVKPGDLFIVYNGKFAIGEIAVLKVEDKVSSALVTYSTEALVLGDRVERR
jgi:hypothetical protein